jgi:hypothetical protein
MRGGNRNRDDRDRDAYIGWWIAVAVCCVILFALAVATSTG